MSIVLTLFYFIVALFLLVTVHECGHFLVARWCGVKVLRFSFGFGKVLASWRDKSGTEYAWSLFPLGGYVKMLDEEEGPVSPAEQSFAFNHQPPWKKIAIAFAGPLFNFIFAFFAIWVVLVVGMTSLAPMIDGVIPGSLADKAGLKPRQEVVAFNHQAISSWRDFQYVLMPLMGTTMAVPLTVRSMRDGVESSLMLPLEQWQFDGRSTDVLGTLGIKPFVPSVPAVVGDVVVGSPADVAGFQTGDLILAVNDSPVTDWLMLLERVQASPGKRMVIEVKRQGLLKKLDVTLGKTIQDGHQIGLLGLHSKRVDWPQGWLRVQRETPLKAIVVAARQTVALTSGSFSLIGRLAMGKVALSGISGPVGIAQGAGESARSGFAYYMYFLALISISLGVLNLLPIPMLDGGHLVYYVIELIRRRPLSSEFKSIGMYFGFVFLMALMVLALTNDIGRLVQQ